MYTTFPVTKHRCFFDEQSRTVVSAKNFETSFVLASETTAGTFVQSYESNSLFLETTVSKPSPFWMRHNIGGSSEQRKLVEGLSHIHRQQQT